MEVRAAALLFAALLLFLVSTRQWALWLRALILISAVLTLTGAGVIIVNGTDHYLLSLASDAWRNRTAIGESAIGVAFRENDRTIGRHVIPLLDLFFLFAVILGAVTAAALTPGERIERVVRPMLFGLIGVMAGAGIALSLVAIGFGGPVKQRSFLAVLSADDVHDGDGIVMGDVSLRLYGIDAPELTQRCFGDLAVRECGQDARNHLADLVAGALVQCTPVVDGDEPPPETFGRPIVRCEARRPGSQPVDLAARMIRDGYAIRYRARETVYADEGVVGAHEGLMTGCLVRPEDWRRNHSATEPLVGDACPDAASR